MSQESLQSSQYLHACGPTDTPSAGPSSSLDAKVSTQQIDHRSSYRGFLLSGLGDKPSKVYELFAALDARDDSNRLQALLGCRGSAWFVRNQKTGEVRVASARCKVRWCPLCEKTDKYAVVNNVAERLKTAYSPKFLTLTLKHSTSPLADQIQHLYKSFIRLRHLKRWKRTISGGVWFFQIKRNQDGTEWHPHLHILVEGGYYEQSELSRDWARASKGSPIVDIRAVRDRAKTVDYVARYACCPCDLSRLTLVDRVEVFDALHHRKIKGTFGTMADLVLCSQPPEDAGDWEYMAGYWEVYNFKHRDLWLAEIWDSWVLDHPCSAIPDKPPPEPPPERKSFDDVVTFRQLWLFRV